MSDRTEAPTPRRRQEAREKGEIARSPEITSAVGILVAFLMLKSTGPSVINNLVVLLQQLPDAMRASLDNPEYFRTMLIQSGLPVGLSLAPFVAAILVAGVITNVAQVGLFFSGQTLQPRWHRVNPFSGFKRLLSPRGIVEMLKAIAKIAVVGFVAYSALSGRINEMVTLGSTDLNSAVALLWVVGTDVGVRVGLAMLVIAVADYAYQRYQHNKSLRMTRQEVIEEMKRYENPFIRSRIRQRQRQIAARRMMADVPKADVVITNPTHLAVAIKYDFKSMNAPQVVAKGERLIAQRIRLLAEENGVPIVERKPLARALFKSVDVGKEIPGDLYEAVAEVLAFIFSLRGNNSWQHPG